MTSRQFGSSPTVSNMCSVTLRKNQHAHVVAEVMRGNPEVMVDESKPKIRVRAEIGSFSTGARSPMPQESIFPV
ncbi:MAG TPA: MmoB/DmpM family protein [Amycolatopsis sp.]|uniref:MmoB/DmpM family protein n=1 Tax=Amycolatopsis sp. TaxID=37632 RepID=UPI002B4AA53D|nr:MmoB/DmpM family protein [Amycolatopsis sp.]HKS47532.1 MmoB/DmpM family protein [Amycolatopsis sp.]